MSDSTDSSPLFADQQGEPPFVTVAKVGEIANGKGRAFALGKRMVAVFCVDDRYYAIDDFCPHQGASLAEGHLDGCTVACPWHYWSFSLESGAWLDNPKIGVESYRVRLQGQDIQVQLPPEAS